MNECKLCGNIGELELSHIFPKFLFRWLKKTGTGRLRGTANINQPVQDGLRAPFLCGSCEDLFSKAETWFSKRVFYPVVDESYDSFEYTEELFYFVISVAWRLLRYSLLDVYKDWKCHSKLLIAEKEWREYLLYRTPVINFGELHLIAGVDIFTDAEEIPERLIFYMGRAVDGNVGEGDEDCMVYVKLPRFVFILPIYGMERDKMINTQININGGHYHLERARIESALIGQFIIQQVHLYNGVRNEMSSVQREKVRKKSEEKWEVLKNKDLGKIIGYEHDNFE